jgi:hypothetical protein
MTTEELLDYAAQILRREGGVRGRRWLECYAQYLGEEKATIRGRQRTELTRRGLAIDEALRGRSVFQAQIDDLRQI